MSKSRAPIFSQAAAPSGPLSIRPLPVGRSGHVEIRTANGQTRLVVKPVKRNTYISIRTLSPDERYQRGFSTVSDCGRYFAFGHVENNKKRERAIAVLLYSSTGRYYGLIRQLDSSRGVDYLTAEEITTITGSIHEAATTTPNLAKVDLGKYSSSVGSILNPLLPDISTPQQLCYGAFLRSGVEGGAYLHLDLVDQMGESLLGEPLKVIARSDAVASDDGTVVITVSAIMRHSQMMELMKVHVLSDGHLWPVAEVSLAKGIRATMAVATAVGKASGLLEAASLVKTVLPGV